MATKGHRIRPRHIYPRFFYWIQLVVLLDVTVFFAGVGVCMRTRFVTPLVRHRTNGMYRIFLKGVSDFWKSFLFISATKNRMYHIFFIRYIRFLFEICSSLRTHANTIKGNFFKIRNRFFTILRNCSYKVNPIVGVEAYHVDY